MAADVTKHLERAKKYLEKNKLREAVAEYEAVLAEAPGSADVLQALGDLHQRLNQADRAARYYGLLFDRYTESHDAAKALVLYNRFLKGVPQPPERVARVALLLQKQNKVDEAIEQYGAAAELFLAQHNEASALACWDKIAQLDPDNLQRHLTIGEVGERIGNSEIAARGYLRAGQLAFGAGDLDRATELLGRAHRLAGRDRTIALFYAQALLERGDAAKAVEQLDPFPLDEADLEFLGVFGEALLRAGKLDRAREVFERFHQTKPDGYNRLFALVDAYLKAGQDAGGVDLLRSLKERMFAAQAAADFTAQADAMMAGNPKSLALADFCVHLYEELNRESRYFDVLVQYFDLALEGGQIARACEALDRLVDIDPYDFRNQERITRLGGKADKEYLRSVQARMAKAATVSGQAPVIPRGAEPSAPAAASDGHARQALDDLIVQTEIFLQYNLRNKAVERLRKIAEMFPGEEETNERLLGLYQQAGWIPEGSARGAPPKAAEGLAAPAAPGAGSPSRSGVYSADLVRDLARISEITRGIYRQATPKAVLSTAVNEVGKYLRVTRCLAMFGPAGQPPQMAAEYCVPDVEPSEGGQIVKLLAHLNQAPPDASGALPLSAGTATVLQEMDVETALGVPLTDKETQTQVGMLVVAHAVARAWKPNEGYFLQAIGDQVVLSANQAKLRSLVRTMGVTDERTGLLARGSYQDCLLAEMHRAKKQGTPVSLILLQVDRGPEILRQHGEANLDRYMEQLARTLQAGVRQNDVAVKYTAWSLAFVLPDTPLTGAHGLADKLRKLSASLAPPGPQGKVTLSAAVTEAMCQPDYDIEDMVTDLINRAEFGLEDARKKGGDTIVSR